MINQIKLLEPETMPVNSEYVSHRIANLKYGDHVCYLYETEEEHKAVLRPFLRQGLERDEKVIYIVDAHDTETVLQYLRDEGVVLEPYLDSGQLSILSSDDVYLRDGIFSPDGMITLLRSETKRALAEGYRALRVTGEMTWVLQESGFNSLNEYEAKLNEFFPGSKCLAICQYDRRRFPPDIVLNALKTHPIIIMGTKVYDNFYYSQHSEFPNQNTVDKDLRHQLNCLEANGQTKEALTESENRYRELADSLPQTVFETDERGRLIFVNRHFFNSTGFTPEDFRNGLDALQLVDPVDRNKAKENMKLVLNGEHLIGSKYKALKKDGSTYPVVAYSAPIIHAHKTIGIRGIVIDTTEHRQAAEELRLLLTMTQAISESHDFQAALKITIRKVCQATGWDYGEAWVPGSDGKFLECSPAWYSNVNSLEKFRQLSEEFTFPPNTGLPGRVWSSRKPEWCPDVSAEPEGVFLRVSIALEAGLKAGYGVPIIANGQVLAVLVFFMRAYRKEDKHLVELVSGVAMQLGSVIQRKQTDVELRRYRDHLEKLVEERTIELIKANGRLQKEITEHRQATKELRLLLTMTQAISESHDFQAALKITIRKVCQATGWDYGEAWVPSHDGKVLERSHVWCNSANNLEKFRQLSEEFTFPPNTGLPGRVWSSRKPEWCPDVSAEPEGVFLRVSIALEAGLKAGYGVPIIANGQVLAVLVFFMMAYRKKDKHLVELVSGVAMQLGSVIQRKQTEETLRELYQKEESLRSELEKQIRHRIEFSRVLVHELKTPLTPILGASRLLADNLKEEPWLSLATNINRGAHNLNGRIDELLDLAKGEIGILKLDCEWVDPSDLLQDVLDYVSPEAEVLEQILISDIPPSLPQVWVDRERLGQVLFNLLNNAFKFNHKGGKVTVKVRQRKDNLIVEVRDTGRGINEHERGRLFQLYTHLENGRDHLSGLGIGLSLSKMLIDLHGGRIWVKSQKGKGSTFGFSVPVKDTGCAE